MEKELILDSYTVNKILGDYDKNLNLINKEFNIKILVTENGLKIVGEDGNVEMAINLIQLLEHLSENESYISLDNLNYSIKMVKGHKEDQIYNLNKNIIAITAEGKPIKPKTLGQLIYIEAIKNNDMVFGIGPAGTGKTYLAIASAVQAFKNKEVSKIILTRPAVEAGESLGFLPGDLKEKVDPYLRPVYDALHEIMGMEQFDKNSDKGLIEVAPLAYMRGRTLDNSFIILDEAQNTTPEQMKMFLTRMGFGSKMIITGDATQTDLPKGKKSGLILARKIINNIRGIKFIDLTSMDVVRNPLVQSIIEAYADYEKEYRDERL